MRGITSYWTTHAPALRSRDGSDVLITPAIPGAELRSYTQQLRHLRGVQRTDVTIGGGHAGQPATQRVSLSTGLDSTSGAAQDLVRQVRAVPAPPGTKVLAGGATATLIDSKHAISSHLVLAGALIVVTTFILLFLFTGSILQPVRALLGNALTLGAALGTMVWIFQDGHFASVLGFTPRPTDTATPVLLFCIAFGLSMDYELFVCAGAAAPDPRPHRHRREPVRRANASQRLNRAATIVTCAETNLVDTNGQLAGTNLTALTRHQRGQYDQFHSGCFEAVELLTPSLQLAPRMTVHDEPIPDPSDRVRPNPRNPKRGDSCLPSPGGVSATGSLSSRPGWSCLPA